MPTKSSIPVIYPDIHRDQRVCHAKYGRGVVRGVHRARGQAGVRFDDDVKFVADPPPRTVLLKDLTPEPADMPAGIDDPLAFARAPFRVERRLCWPLDRAGERA